MNLPNGCQYFIPQSPNVPLTVFSSHTAAKLGSVTEDFLREIKQKFSAHVVIMIGFPDEDGVPLLSL